MLLTLVCFAGEKFLVGSQFFKFVADFEGLYGGDEVCHACCTQTMACRLTRVLAAHTPLQFARKSAGHELKGLRGYLNCNLPDLRTPLFALIDYCGSTLMATSRLPLAKGSLVYGSADAGAGRACSLSLDSAAV